MTAGPGFVGGSSRAFCSLRHGVGHGATALAGCVAQAAGGPALEAVCVPTRLLGSEPTSPAVFGTLTGTLPERKHPSHCTWQVVRDPRSGSGRTWRFCQPLPHTEQSVPWAPASQLRTVWPCREAGGVLSPGLVGKK